MKFVRKTRGGAEVYIGRSDSQGLDATIANGDHHAKRTVPLAAVLGAAMEDVPAAKWVQFNNVHEIIMHSGQCFRFRPLYTQGYIGLEMVHVVPKLGEVGNPLQITEPSDVPTVIALLHLYARPQHVNRTKAAQRRQAAGLEPVARA